MILIGLILLRNKMNLIKKNILSEKINYNLALNEIKKFTIKNKNPFVLANAGSIALFQLYKKLKNISFK